VRGLRKGLLIETLRGTKGRLCGSYGSGYRYYDLAGKRQSARRLAWVSSNYVVTPGARCSSQHATFPATLKGGVP
jgi:hypothetical protein